MEWYWIALLAFWAAGSPFGIAYALSNPDVFYKHPIRDVLDIFAAVLMYVVTIAFMMIAGWFFGALYCVQAIRSKRRSSKFGKS